MGKTVVKSISGSVSNALCSCRMVLALSFAAKDIERTRFDSGLCALLAPSENNLFVIGDIIVVL